VFGKLGEGVSPFPYALVFPQDEHEKLLIERLAQLGVNVERRTELVRFEETAERVAADIKLPDGTAESCEIAYLAGCDGAHSAVRQGLGIGFPGGIYSHLFYVADVQGTGPVMDGDLHVALDRADFIAIFPLKGEGRVRLVGTVRDQAAHARDPLDWNDVGKTVIESMRINVERVNWFSTYRVHHRVADRFRQRRAFLLGDAAHIHSPVGGQGMNTGIGDAVNLAWKLASVLHGRVDASLLDSYQPERIAFARRLVATTDQAFTAVTSPTLTARLVRLELVPFLMPKLFKLTKVRRYLFRTVSQTLVNYRESSLSEGRAGSVHGGDRLPWIQMTVKGTEHDNFEPLASLDWQVQIYGQTTSDLQTFSSQRSLPLRVFPWNPELGRAGLQQNALYLVRPDGYIALADPSATVKRLASYLNRINLRL
jgi:2-polyprenyl-6-methoxyphenol hydroxylase-like FAD-dependent oxidoreductase